MNNIEFIRPEEVDLNNCDREAIHTPGFIQPHGVLLVLQETDFTILQASNNTEKFLGISVDQLIGKPLNILFSQRQIQRVKNHIFKQPYINLTSPILVKKIFHQNFNFNCYIHRNQPVIILELEPLTINRSLSIDFYDLIKQSILKIKQASTFQETTELIVKEIRQITGYDRVMIYRFEPDGTGVVIAEDKDEKVQESYLDLHYPASDIPKQARKLYYANWLRLIVDFNYQPVEIIPLNNPLTNLPTDLSFCFLRSISPIHVEYAKNMGVTASISISLIDDKKLWGLIVCHHYSPKYVDYKLRNYCEFLGQLMSLELVKRQEQEAEKHQEKIKLIQNQIKESIEEHKKLIHTVFKQNSLNILELVNAQGAAIYIQDEITLLGKTPSLEAVKDLINWFLSSTREEIFFTNSLSQVYPAAQQFKAQASGLLAISVFLQQTSYHIFCFRPELIYTVNWGGNPHKAVLVTDDGNLRLSPRRSFELWKETVSQKSLPWQQIEIDAAYQLRDTLLLAALEFSQTALQKAAERAEIANRAKSEFLSRVSHELRTPLNAILGYSQLMNRNTSLSPQQKEYIEIINRSGEHLLSLINDVLEMSKIEAGQQTLNENSFDLYALLDSIEKTFQLKASAKKLGLIFQRSQDVPQFVVTDESKLRQVLFNLLDNAIKFTQTGNVTLWVTTKEAPCLKIFFSVSDTGPGIAESELSVLFDPFVQTQAGLKSMQGTGLGLPISRQFIELMGGELTVNTQLGSGSTFSFDISVTLADRASIFVSNSHQRVIGLQGNQPHYRILIVEDVEDNRRLLFELLAQVGFEVRTADNGVEAISLWQQWHPHLILMDMLMPVMNGSQATRQIKATQEGEKTVIIAITANAFSDDQLAAIKVGCDDFITKPFREQILFEKIAQHLGVRYRYEEEQTINEVSESFDLSELKPNDLTVMSDKWLGKLHEAAMALDDVKILELIEEIPASQTILAKNLNDLVENFRLDIIFHLTSAARDSIQEKPRP
ncbi:response regulator [Gloeothece verrucosa]|uniref:Circadian input-output histidine kinase CikA n=1 Tax=Gloeothece verrucosa (strain PCC 7822) TaxID=497965 RepID=E0UHW9_GLOV7|nr:response regulator [Gloeothece verrucosa]ADN14499.1 multi-sensor hybrid histidine kinase [Gloeothece verrucosa PCC 7822]